MKPVSKRELQERFDDFINEVFEPVTYLGQYHYDHSRLRDLDPVAYNQEFLSWLDTEISEGRIKEDDNGNYFEGEES